MVDLDKILKKIELLQPIPAIIHRISASLGDPDTSLSDLIDIVEKDPAITANLLKICNSAHFGLVGKVDSIHRAVTLLGVQRLAELVLTFGLSENLNKALEAYSLAKGELWKRSVAGAMLAGKLAEHRQLDNRPVIYTSALLRDIGKVILNEYVSDELLNIKKMVCSEGLSFLEAEKACIGIDHAELGGLIARHWNFSPNLVFIIKNHHLTDSSARNHRGTVAVYWADMVAMLVGTGSEVDRLAYHVDEGSFEDFLLSKDELKTLMMMYKGFFQGAERLFAFRQAA
ncbi:MAG: HDOD domain-containing protein [Desulfobacteraceae bacterium]|nr:HDOD domain-containing protein [Desulfobacteraceae bacterium]